jgi:hypothetical protein
MKKVAIQGIKGSYHYQVAKEYFNDSVEIIEFLSFDDVANSVSNGICELGIMAIENSIAGSIIPNYALIDGLNLNIVGEVSNLKLLCPDDKKTYADVELNLTEVKVQVGEDHTNKIELDKGMGMIMTYPTINSFADGGIKDINASNMLEVIGSCILQIFEKKGEKVYETKDQTKKEVEEFIESLNTKQFKDVQQFFESMPKLKHEITITNPKTKVESKITLTGLNDFFE